VSCILLLILLPVFLGLPPGYNSQSRSVTGSDQAIRRDALFPFLTELVFQGSEGVVVGGIVGIRIGGVGGFRGLLGAHIEEMFLLYTHADGLAFLHVQPLVLAAREQVRRHAARHLRVRILRYPEKLLQGWVVG